MDLAEDGLYLVGYLGVNVFLTNQSFEPNQTENFYLVRLYG